jgi:hypothetical protein
VTLEQVAMVADAVASRIWNRWIHSEEVLAEILAYRQYRNPISYECRRRRGRARVA